MNYTISNIFLHVEVTEKIVIIHMYHLFRILGRVPLKHRAYILHEHGKQKRAESPYIAE